jgi:hypothetical protein
MISTTNSQTLPNQAQVPDDLSENFPANTQETFSEDMQKRPKNLRNSTKDPRISQNTLGNSPKDSDAILRNTEPTDGRKKPRSQRQVEAYRRNFARRHSQKPQELSEIQEISFLPEEYIRNPMSVFDPNQNYDDKSSQSVNPEELYETVTQVQEILQEITSLLHAPYEESQYPLLVQRQQPKAPSRTPSDETIETTQPTEEAANENYPEDQPSIYDNIF